MIRRPVRAPNRALRTRSGLLRASLLAVWLVGLPACAPNAPVVDPFEARRREAEANLGNEIGRDYDRWLGQFFEARPEVGQGLTDCFSRHAQRPPLQGYIVFATDGGYHLELRPRGGYADCVAEAFAGFKPPPPPTLPYVNPFDLGVVPPAPRD